jgi:hypothetical protein
MTTITLTESFHRTASITKVKAVPNTYHMEIRTALASAKNPSATVREFDMIVDRAGLKRLRTEINDAIGCHKENND